MTKKEQIRLVEEQFAVDYNCTIEDFQNGILWLLPRRHWKELVDLKKTASCPF